MSVSLKAKTVAFAAGLSCLFVAYAIGQPGQLGQPVRPPDTTPQPGGAPTGQSQITQPGQPQTYQQPGQTIARGEDREVEQYFAACLLEKNQCEVELSKLAAERTQNPQVKQFAQQMITDHQALIPKLQQIAGTQYGAQRSTTAIQLGGVQQANYDTPANTSGQAGQFGQPGQTVGQTEPVRTPGQPAQLPATSGRQGTQGDLNQVATIEKQIGERILQAQKQKLEEKRGEEFDQCYMGSQMMAHMHMSVALEVLKDQTSGQLRQIVQEAQPKVKQHLAIAEQIGEQLMKSQTRQAGLEKPAAETVPRVPR